jgi:hypothetical protein
MIIYFYIKRILIYFLLIFIKLRIIECNDVFEKFINLLNLYIIFFIILELLLLLLNKLFWL